MSTVESKIVMFPLTRVRQPDEPCWNSAVDCRDRYFDSGKRDFPRGGLSITQWTHMFFGSMNDICQKQYIVYMTHIPPAEDETKKTFYIDRFILLPSSTAQLFNDFIKKKHNVDLPPVKDTYRDIEINYLFLLRAREIRLWNKKTWNKVRGKVAINNLYSSFWNDKILERLRISFIVENPSTQHGLALPKHLVETTKAVMDYKNTKISGMKHRMVSLGVWNSRIRHSGEGRTLIFCPTLIWFYFGIPKTHPQLYNTSLYRCGILRTGSINNLRNQNPFFYFSISQIKPFANQNKIMNVLYDKYMSVVCYFYCFILAQFII